MGRRGFLKLMGASLALAGATACTRQPDELIVPYVRQPENLVPGRPLFFATAMPLSGSAIGLLAESHEGRPTKIEGNPGSPGEPRRDRRLLAGLGAAALRSRSVDSHHVPRRDPSVGHVRAGHGPGAQPAQGGAGRGAAVPDRIGRRRRRSSASSQEVLAALPQAKWHQWEPVNDDNAHAGARLAFGEVGRDARINSIRPGVVVSLGADFLGAGPGSVRYSRDFANGRRVRKAKAEMNRLYVGGDGAFADRLDCGPSPAGARQRYRGDRAGAARGGQLEVGAASGAGQRRVRQVDRRRCQRPAGAIAVPASSSRATSSRPPSTRSRTR